MSEFDLSASSRDPLDSSSITLFDIDLSQVDDDANQPASDVNQPVSDANQAEEDKEVEPSRDGRPVLRRTSKSDRANRTVRFLEEHEPRSARVRKKSVDLTASLGLQSLLIQDQPGFHEDVALRTLPRSTSWPKLPRLPLSPESIKRARTEPFGLRYAEKVKKETEKEEIVSPTASASGTASVSGSFLERSDSDLRRSQSVQSGSESPWAGHWSSFNLDSSPLSKKGAGGTTPRPGSDGRIGMDVTKDYALSLGTESISGSRIFSRAGTGGSNMSDPLGEQAVTPAKILAAWYASSVTSPSTDAVEEKATNEDEHKSGKEATDERRSPDSVASVGSGSVPSTSAGSGPASGTPGSNSPKRRPNSDITSRPLDVLTRVAHAFPPWKATQSSTLAGSPERSEAFPATTSVETPTGDPPSPDPCRPYNGQLTGAPPYSSSPDPCRPYDAQLTGAPPYSSSSSPPPRGENDAMWQMSFKEEGLQILNSPALDTRTISEEPKPFQQGMLSIIVLGALGDVAQRKTYPSLMNLFLHNFLPPWVSIMGYAHSALQSEEFRAKLRPWLLRAESDGTKVELFLDRCTYFKGSYDKTEDFADLNRKLSQLENADSLTVQHLVRPGLVNRLFYFTLPLEIFLSSASCVKSSAMTNKGFNRIIMEKPFGYNLMSAGIYVAGLGALFPEDCIYRIDDYLEKDLLRNLYKCRFCNTFLEPSFNRNHISSVQITFKELCGTEGCGGHFTHVGIIRDVIQNTLMQVLSILAMEPPPRMHCEDSVVYIRNAKSNLLRSISPIDPAEVIIGQYVAADGKPGYLEDDTIEDRETAKYVATFAAIVLRINNKRWEGVPFILKAGKALDQRRVEVRVKYRHPHVNEDFLDGQCCAANELVMQLHPDESVSMGINVTEPGFATKPISSEMDLPCKSQYQDMHLDSHTRLILEALRGANGTFPHGDELLNSWQILDPLLMSLEKVERRIPMPYSYGSSGPPAAEQLLLELEQQCQSMSRARPEGGDDAERNVAPKNGANAARASSPKTAYRSTALAAASRPATPKSMHRTVSPIPKPQHRSQRVNSPRSSLEKVRARRGIVQKSGSNVAATIAKFENVSKNSDSVARTEEVSRAEQHGPQNVGYVKARGSVFERRAPRAATAHGGAGTGRADRDYTPERLHRNTNAASPGPKQRSQSTYVPRKAAEFARADGNVAKLLENIRTEIARDDGHDGAATAVSAGPQPRSQSTIHVDHGHHVRATVAVFENGKAAAARLRAAEVKRVAERQAYSWRSRYI